MRLWKEVFFGRYQVFKGDLLVLTFVNLGDLKSHASIRPSGIKAKRQTKISRVFHPELRVSEIAGTPFFIASPHIATV